MRRLLLAFLMLLMPLQSVWSAAASVCSHEQAQAGERHFGHHDAHHANAVPAASASMADDADSGGPERAAALEGDHHHVLSATPVPSMPSITTPVSREQRVHAAPADPHPSAPVASLERPPRASAEHLRHGV